MRIRLAKKIVNEPWRYHWKRYDEAVRLVHRKGTSTLKAFAVLVAGTLRRYGVQ